ncbi:lytic polysaccharide monooxygenase [Xylaria palmicola]|nr:lytic polysaccharide monooxygenase [Xylaria palmicola]
MKSPRIIAMTLVVARVRGYGGVYNYTIDACNRGNPATKSLPKLHAPVRAGANVTAWYLAPPCPTDPPMPFPTTPPVLFYGEADPPMRQGPVMDGTRKLWFKVWETEYSQTSWPGWEPRDTAVSAWEAWEAGYIIRRGVNMTIPRALKLGNYLIRHEVINLEANLQLYPECAQLSVTGEGDTVPGPEYLVEFPGANHDDQKDLAIPGDLYSSKGHGTHNFTMPGPKVWIPETVGTTRHSTPLSRICGFSRKKAHLSTRLGNLVCI